MASDFPDLDRRDAIMILGGGALAAAVGSNALSAQAQEDLQPPTRSPERILVTGSSDGLGLAAARRLIGLGHHVVLHGRNRSRADDAVAAASGAEAAVIGDVSVIAQTRALADQVNRIGPCDAVIHNVGIGGRTTGEKTADGLPSIFAVNTLAPYMLTALIGKPKRLVYVSSSAHRGVTLDLDDLTFGNRPWDGWAAYAESKLQDVLIAFAVARRWPDVFSNAMDPGWVPTQMGGAGAPGSVAEGAETEAWLAASNGAAAQTSGRFFYHKREQQPNAAAHDRQLQDRLLATCERISGTRFPT